MIQKKIIIFFLFLHHEYSWKWKWRKIKESARKLEVCNTCINKLFNQTLKCIESIYDVQHFLFNKLLQIELYLNTQMTTCCCCIDYSVLMYIGMIFNYRMWRNVLGMSSTLWHLIDIQHWMWDLHSHRSYLIT